MDKRVIKLKFTGDVGIQYLREGIWEFLKTNKSLKPSIILMHPSDKRFTRSQQTKMGLGNDPLNNDVLDFHQSKISFEGFTVQLENSDRMLPGEIEIH